MKADLLIKTLSLGLLAFLFTSIYVGCSKKSKTSSSSEISSSVASSSEAYSSVVSSVEEVISSSENTSQELTISSSSEEIESSSKFLEVYQIKYFVYGEEFTSCFLQEGYNLSVEDYYGSGPNDEIFVGWKIEGDDTLYKAGDKIIVNSNISFNGVFVESATIEYKANGNIFAKENVIVGSEYTIKTYTGEVREHYSYTGWEDANSKAFYHDGDTITITGNLQLNAFFAIDKHKIEYMDVKNQPLDTDVVSYGDWYTIENYQGELDEDTEFVKWRAYDSETYYSIGSNVLIHEDLKLIPVVNKKVTINYYVDEVLYKSVKIDAYEDYIMEVYEKVPEGKVFVGWRMKDDGHIYTYAPGKTYYFSDSYDFYGKTADKMTYMLSFYYFDETEVQIEAVKGEKVEAPEISYKTDYEFTEYWWAANGSDFLGDTFEGEADMAYFPTIRDKVFTITFVDQDGNKVGSTTATYYGIFYINVPEKEGYHITEFIDQNGNHEHYSVNYEKQLLVASDVEYIIVYVEDSASE